MTSLIISLAGGEQHVTTIGSGVAGSLGKNARPKEMTKGIKWEPLTAKDTAEAVVVKDCETMLVFYVQQLSDGSEGCSVP